MTFRLFASALAARDYFPLLRWMIFTGVTVFGFAIAWRYGLFRLMMAQDQTRISAFICILVYPLYQTRLDIPLGR